MTRALVDINEWREINPAIHFDIIKKSFFKQYLIKVQFKIDGSDKRYYGAPFSAEPNTKHPPKIPTQQQFTDYVYEEEVKYNTDLIIEFINSEELYKKVQLQGNRYIYVPPQPNRFRTTPITYDTHVLYKLHLLRLQIPKGIRLSRSFSSIFIYGNDIEQIKNIILNLGLDLSIVDKIHFASPGQIKNLLEGKEYSEIAHEFKYKVFFANISKANMPLYIYLRQLEDTGECKITGACKAKLLQQYPEGSHGASTSFKFWSHPGKTYIYLNDLNYLTFIRLIDDGKYSEYVELIAPDPH